MNMMMSRETVFRIWKGNTEIDNISGISENSLNRAISYAAHHAYSNRGERVYLTVSSAGSPAITIAEFFKGVA